MTPTQYQAISERLDDIKAGQAALRAEVQAALIEQATQREQIKILQKGTGGAIAFGLTIAVAWAKARLHL